MHVTDKLTRSVSETKYLTADNVDRYRCIMRIFYENYERLKYWLYQDEIYALMKQEPYFTEYTQQQCQQDLNALADWRNLIPIQDTRKVNSIEEFRNKKYRYQMSEYSVEIERLVLRLENLQVEGASLEPTLLERIRRGVEKLFRMTEEPEAEVYTWWNDLNNDFIRLNQNYQDYIRELNSVRAEEMMRTREFLVFKDRLVEYLRGFIRGLQSNVGVIEELLRSVREEDLEILLGKAADYEFSIPRLDQEITRERILEKNRGRFQSIYGWFASSESGENEAGKLFDETNDIIRRITRYAAQLSERNALGANRKEEYKKAAQMFLRCESMEEAHRMSAMVFGLERPFHISAGKERDSDSMNQSIYEERPGEILLKPRVRTYRDRVLRSGIVSHQKEREEALRQLKEEMLRNQKRLRELEKDGRIDFETLPVIDGQIREILLKWLSDAMENQLTGRTDDGRSFHLDIDPEGETCVVACEDGKFTMPKTSIIFDD